MILIRNKSNFHNNYQFQNSFKKKEFIILLKKFINNINEKKIDFYINYLIFLTNKTKNKFWEMINKEILYSLEQKIIYTHQYMIYFKLYLLIINSFPNFLKEDLLINKINEFTFSKITKYRLLSTYLIPFVKNIEIIKKNIIIFTNDSYSFIKF